MVKKKGKRSAKSDEKTVVLIKPDGVKKKVVGEIITRLERVGLTISAAKLLWADEIHIGKHYKNDKEYSVAVGNKALELYIKYGFDIEENFANKRPEEIGERVRKWNMEFLSSGPVFAILLSGPNAVMVVRKLAGSTFSSDAPPGTIRGDFGSDSIFSSNKDNRAAENVVHVSATVEEAEFERQLWFQEKEIYTY